MVHCRGGELPDVALGVLDSLLGARPDQHYCSAGMNGAHLVLQGHCRAGWQIHRRQGIQHPPPLAVGNKTFHLFHAIHFESAVALPLLVEKKSAPRSNGHKTLLEIHLFPQSGSPHPSAGLHPPERCSLPQPLPDGSRTTRKPTARRPHSQHVLQSASRLPQAIRRFPG